MSEERILNEKFGVGILFWSDIEQDLSKYINEVARFYPHFFQGQQASVPTTSTRHKDITLVTEILKYIDLESVNYYIEMAPKSISFKFIEHVDPFQELRSSPIFHLYDQYLSNYLNSWLDKWCEISTHVVNGPYNYIEKADRLTFAMPGDGFQSVSDEATWNKLQFLFNEFKQLQNTFCQFIHRNYQEIDLKTTSEIARAFHSS